jgi:hypothetical protein
MKGDAVKVEITVKNTGARTCAATVRNLATPTPTRDTFASVEGGRYADADRVWRVGVDWAGGLGAEGARYPYRWGPGQGPWLQARKPRWSATSKSSKTTLRFRLYARPIHEKWAIRWTSRPTAH